VSCQLFLCQMFCRCLRSNSDAFFFFFFFTFFYFYLTFVEFDSISSLNLRMLTVNLSFTLQAYYTGRL